MISWFNSARALSIFTASLYLAAASTGLGSASSYRQNTLGFDNLPAKASLKPERSLILQDSQGQAQRRAASARITPIFQCQGAAMRFCNPATKNRADAGSTLLGCKERHKQVGTIGETGSLIGHPHMNVLSIFCPANLNEPTGFERCIGSIMEKIDKKLIKLIAVGRDRQRRPLDNLKRQAGLQNCHTMDLIAHITRCQCRVRETRQAPVRGPGTG